MSDKDFTRSRKLFFDAVGIGTSPVVLPLDAWSSVRGQDLSLKRVDACRGAVLQAHDWRHWICIGAVDRYTIGEGAEDLELIASVHRAPSQVDAIEWCHGDWIFGFTTEDFHIGFDGVVTEQPATFPIGSDLVGQEFSIRLTGELKVSLTNGTAESI
jgi:hypothetical protein